MFMNSKLKTQKLLFPIAFSFSFIFFETLIGQNVNIALCYFFGHGMLYYSSSTTFAKNGYIFFKSPPFLLSPTSFSTTI